MKKTYTLHLLPQQGETRGDVAARIVGAVHERIDLVNVVVRSAGVGVGAKVVLDAFGNEVEVEDHRRRFAALGAHVTVR